MKKEIPVENEEAIEPEVVQELDLETIQEIAETTKELVPQMNVGLTAPGEANPPPIISNEKLVETYDEVMNNVRQEREELNGYIDKFADLVFNDGDATTSTKEALINLLKIRSDTSDKMSKIADLMTRARGINTFPRYMANNQNNTINIGDGTGKKAALSPAEKRALIENENKKMGNN